MIIKASEILTIFYMIILLSSCNNLEPAGFWTKYQKDQIVQSVSDQGPWGGSRAINWQAEKEHTFNSKIVLAFALKHGWQFMDSIRFSKDSLKSWKEDDRNIFPLSFTGFSPSAPSYFDTNFPRWINSNLTLYKFKTGWEAIQPGSDSSTEENGFVIINEKGTEMSIYHLWGD